MLATRLTAIDAGMNAPIGSRVPLRDALRGLSMALDLAMGRRLGHARATAALAEAVARRLGLTEPEIEELAFAALLKDAG